MFPIFKLMHKAAFFALLLLAFCQCRKEQNAAISEPTVLAVPAAIQAYTSGMIGREEALFVQFADLPADATLQIRTAPTTAGEVVRKGNTLRYLPAEGWASGKTYQVTVDLPSGGVFSFPFTVVARKAAVVAEGVYLPPSGAGGPTVTGQVLTNDVATPAEISRMLSARQGDRKLEVTVAALPGNQAFSYSVAGPQRGSDPAPVVISYAGETAGFADLSGETIVEIPADDDFRVLDVSVTDEGSILLRFSDVLETRQDFRGQLVFGDKRTAQPVRNDYTTAADGNLLRVYPRGSYGGTMTLTVNDGLLNAAGKRLGVAADWELAFGPTTPALRTVSDGAILPHQGKRLFPFDAVGLRAVQLEVTRIFENNITQYLQDNSLEDADNEWQISRVGRIVARERIELSSLSEAVNTSRWSRYALDLGAYIDDNTSAIYQVRIGFAMGDAVTGCNVDLADFGLEPFAFSAETAPATGFQQITSQLGDYYGVHGYYEGREWEDQEDPCKPAYYNPERFIAQHVISSNLGLIAKRNPDRTTVVFTTDLLAAKARSGVTVKAYDRQRQEIFSGTTDAMGRVVMETEQAPEVIMGVAGNDVAYLDVYDQPALPLSRFAIDGAASAAGIKGAFYAERGVWRPGDSVFLHFVLEDRQAILPANYPVTFVLYDPRGRVVERRTVTPAFGKKLYPLPFQTQPEDITGRWRAEVLAGGTTYTESLRIETVKPNRLAIDLQPPAGRLSVTNNQLTLVSKWLYGAPASALRASVRLSVRPRPLDLADWSGYAFQDPARKIEENDLGEAFAGKLDAAGRATFPVDLPTATLPGPVTLGLATQVFEPGGNFSIDNQRIPYEPFTVYAGLNIPTNEWGTRQLGLDEGGRVDLAAIDFQGGGVSQRSLTVGLYRVSWQYWWQDNYDNVAQFASSQHTEALESWTATTDRAGRASVTVKVPDWGRYLLRVCDSGGHCAGQYFYAGTNPRETDRESASLLRPVARKSTVRVGEKVEVTIPSSEGGNVLVSLETGAGTQEQFWVPAGRGETRLSFTADDRMVPTVYVNLTLLQPYEQTTNDRPIRLYGVVPIEVTDPETVLEPEIVTTDTWAPRETVTVRVTEENDQPMTYTLAVVDEGLLGLTRFPTPDLHQQFFSKEALSVRTFDLYRYVIGSLNGDFGKVLAIGGDGALEKGGDPTANRFEPVVRHLGPFRLAGGEQGIHRVELPNYVGAVRVMVVAADDRAYGSSSKRIPVQQPLMLLPTLPRQLAPGERVDMPVNVFAMTDQVKNVRVSVADPTGLTTVAAQPQPLTFAAAGNQLLYFPLTVGDRPGVARLAVTGTGGGEQASQEIEIAVRHPNRETSRATTVVIPPGETQTVRYAPFGLPASQAASLELSALPALQLDRHLRRLLRYPYGCAEQTISPAFAQLHLEKLVQLSDEQRAQCRTGVTAALTALREFQTASGGIAYWPGQPDVHPWASNYALHFITEAERAGYGVPEDLRQGLLRFQQQVARNWKMKNRVFYASTRQLQLDQAYRLYGLALAGQTAVGAMNRLRGQADALSNTARYQLAAAYALAGQQGTAATLTAQVPTEVATYRETGHTFGSDIRDMALILEAAIASGDPQQTAQLALRLARRLGQRNWLSTQEAALAIVALGKSGASASDAVSADFTAPGGKVMAVGTNAGIRTIELPVGVAEESSVTIKNTGTAPLYATVVTAGKPRAGEEKSRSSHLALSVRYTDRDGQPLDVSRLPSGTEFTATYTVRNPGTLGEDYRQLALRSLVPSGWEITNDRLSPGASTNTGFAYQDFRDDGVYTFFDLAKGASRTFSFTLTATYPGRYYLPAQLGEAMYNDEIQAVVEGQWVEVSR